MNSQPQSSKQRKTTQGLDKEYSAGYVIFHQENGVRKYLILHYLSGRYDFAQGHLESGETPEQAAHRELTEETGITEIEIIPRFAVQVNYSFRRIFALINKTTTLFLARVRSQNVIISSEHQGYEWLTFEQAFQKITYEKEKRVIADADKYLNKLNLK